MSQLYYPVSELNYLYMLKLSIYVVVNVLLLEDSIDWWYENDIFQKSGRRARVREQAKKKKGNDNEFSFSF